MARKLVGVLSVVALVAACTAASTPPATPPGSTPGPSSPGVSGPPVATPDPSASITDPPPTGDALPAAALPVRGEEVRVTLEPSMDGVVHAVMAGDEGAVVVRLDATGRPSPGWPVRIPDSTECRFVEAAADGTVRLVCDATDIVQPDLCCDTVRAYALATDGRLLPGWPVEIDVTSAARVVGNDLVVLAHLPTTDTVAFGEVTSEAHLTRIAPDGARSDGPKVDLRDRGGFEEWAIGPDGVAYALSYVATSEGQDPPYTTTEILAVDLGGMVAGWPVDTGEIATALGFSPDGRILVSVGRFDEVGLSVLRFGPAGGSVAEGSDEIPVAGPSSGLDCRGPQELLTSVGRVVLGGDVPAYYALDPGLSIVPGWPYTPPRERQPMAFGGPDPGDLDCGDPPSAVPALGSDGTLYVPLIPISDPDGGELVAVGRDGTVVPGWPIALRRPAAGFWSVAVGPDLTVYALAAELEAAGVSKTLLAIAPDSTVLWRTTLVEP